VTNHVSFKITVLISWVVLEVKSICFWVKQSISFVLGKKGFIQTLRILVKRKLKEK